MGPDQLVIVYVIKREVFCLNNTRLSHTFFILLNDITK